MFLNRGWRRSIWAVAAATLLNLQVVAGQGDELAVSLVSEELRQFLQDRDWPAALQAVERELQQPDAVADRLLYLRGRILYYQEQYDAAVQALREVEQRYPASPWARRAQFAAAMALAKQGNFPSAGQIYRAEAEALLSPERAARTADLYLSYADACFHPADEETKPDFTTALLLYEKALDAGPNPQRRLEVELRVARCYQLLKQEAEAAPRYAAFLQGHPESPLAVEAMFRLGECQFTTGNLLQARLTWQDLLAAHHEDSSSWIAEAAFQLSRTWGLPSPHTDEHLLLGVEALRAFLERFPTHERAGEAHLDMAESYIHRFRFPEAAQTLEDFLSNEQLATSAALPRARQRLANAYLQQGRLIESIRAGQDFLTRHPSDAAWSEVQRQVIDTEYLMAANELEARQYEAARELLQEFLARYPLDTRAPEILWLFGDMSYQQERWDDAVSQWRQLVSKYPESDEAARAHYQIAVALDQKLGRPREALEEYRKVVRGDYAGRAREAEAQMTAPAMTVSTPRVFRSDEKPHLELITRNIRCVTLRVYRLNMESYFRKVGTIGNVEQLDIGLIDPDVSLRFEVPGYEDYREIISQPEIVIPGGVDRGAVAVTVSSDSLEATTLMLQSNLEIIVQASRNDVLVLAEDMQTGQPWPGVHLLLSDGQRVFAEATSGSDGVLHATYRELASCPDVRVAALCDGHVASNKVALEGISATRALPDKGYIYTDRPVYQAGDSVYVRGCIRRADTGEWTIEAGRAHELEVFDPRERSIWHEPTALSPFGTFNIQFPLPATSPPGTYRIQAKDEADHVYHGTFLVDAGHSNPIRVSVNLPKSVYYRGEEITGTIRAAYDYGEPLRGQRIQYQLENDRDFAAWTNDKGEVPFTLSTRNFFADQVVTVTVKLPDHKIEQQRRLYLAVRGFTVDVSTPRNLYLTDEEFNVVLTTRSAEGKPVGQPFNLELCQLTKAGNILSEQVIDEYSVVTNEADGTATVALKVETAGQYRLRATGEDPQENPVIGQRDVVISGDDDRTRLRLLVDDRRWRVGDRAEVTLHWRDEPAMALVTMQADRVWDYQLVQLQRGPNPLPIDLDARFAPQVQLQAVVIRDTRTAPGSEAENTAGEQRDAERFVSASHTFHVDHALQINLSYPGQEQEKNRIRPGQSLEITIHTTDMQGLGVPAEISLALVEEADSAPSFGPSPFGPSPFGPSPFGPSPSGPSPSGPSPLALSDFFQVTDRPLCVRTGSGIAFGYHPTTIPNNHLPSVTHHRRTQQPPFPTRVPAHGNPPTSSTPPAGSAQWPGMPVPPGTYPGMPMAEQRIPAQHDNAVLASNVQTRSAQRWNTAYWCPTVTTDSTGKAAVTVTIPRRLATWKIVAKGITQQAVAGEAVETIVAHQELFGELRVPAALVGGDETEIVAIVHHELIVPATVDAQLTVNFEGQVFEETRSVTVTDSGHQVVRFPIAPLVLNRQDSTEMPSGGHEYLATIRLLLKQGERVDTIDRSVPVLPQGMTSRATTSGVAEAKRSVPIDPPAGAARDSWRLRVSVRTGIEGSLWDAVMLPRGTSRAGDSPASMTDSLSSDLMAALAVQQMLQLPRTANEPRARQLTARICTTIAELVCAQTDAGAWGWSLGAVAHDRYATARVVWALSLARGAGYRVSDDCLQPATKYLTAQLAETAPHDHESKAILLHALTVAGQPDFSLANRLHRERAQLSTPALLYLALTFVAMDRLPVAADLLSICEQRAERGTAAASPPPAAPLAAHVADVQWLALHALALTSTDPDATTSGAVIDQVLARRRGLRWTPDRATGPATLALCRWFERHRPSGQAPGVKVSVNDLPAQTLDLSEGSGEHLLEFPTDQLVDGPQRVVLEPTGPGGFAYEVSLSGVLSADPLQSSTQAWQVTREYAPAPREQDGRSVPRGFDIVRDKTIAFVNPLTQLPVGQRGEVELQIKRNVASHTPAEMLEYLIVTEPIPSGVTVLPETLRGSYERVDMAPGTLTFWLGKAGTFLPIRYEVVGQFAGQSQAGATVVCNAYRPGEFAVAQPKQMRVLPAGAASTDPYQWTPRELYELGRHAYQQRDWPRAEALLTQLLSQYSLQPEPYRESVEMLLEVALELQKSDQIVRYFEIIFEQWPDKEFVLDKVMRIGSAYQQLGEAERSFQVFRAAVEGAFTREGGVAGVLLGMGKRVPSAHVLWCLLNEYPPEPYVATAHLALAQQIADWAPEAARDPQLRAAGLQSSDLITAAWQMQEGFLTEYPLAPTADQAAFAAANALLESKEFARAAKATERYAARYPDSELLDDFWFMAGYCHFILGEPDSAIQLLRNVASGSFLDRASGQMAESDNKWSAIYVLGQIYHSLGQVVEALGEYRRVEDRFPDARASIVDFLREDIRLPALTTLRPGEPVEVELTHRNVAACELTVYRIDLEKFSLLRRDLAGVHDINLAGIEPYRETTVALGDGKDYRDLRRMLPLELTENGAYLIVCRGGSRFASGLVLVTPLELEVHRDPQTGTVRVTLKDVTNDQYVHGAEVKVIGAGNSTVVSGQTDRRGLFVAEQVAGSPTVIAHAGSGNFAYQRGSSSMLPLSQPGAQAARETILQAAAQDLDGTGTVLTGPGEDLGDQRILKILKAPAVLKCEETPLRDVANLIMEQYHFTVILDRRALDDVGLSGDTPLTFDATGLSLGAALNLMLKEVDLTYVVRDEALKITTPEEAENELTTVAYPVTELIRYRDHDGKIWSDFDTLIQTITSNVAPDAWDEVGGAGGIDALPVQGTDVLVVSQTWQVHQQIVSLLQRLRTIAAKDRPNGEIPVREPMEIRPRDVQPGSGGFSGPAGMGGMGGGGGAGGFGGRNADEWGGAPSMPGVMLERSGQPGESGRQQGSDLLQGLEETKRRLQGKQADELERLYEQGKRGMKGGVGAGGFF